MAVLPAVLAAGASARWQWTGRNATDAKGWDANPVVTDIVLTTFGTPDDQ
ncbi:hypothetical protein ACWGH4_06650 [Streptomyces sp. NPDC054847]